LQVTTFYSANYVKIYSKQSFSIVITFYNITIFTVFTFLKNAVMVTMSKRLLSKIGKVVAELSFWCELFTQTE